MRLECRITFKTAEMSASEEMLLRAIFERWIREWLSENAPIRDPSSHAGGREDEALDGRDVIVMQVYAVV
jgi:hypothetical protein